MVAIAWTPKLMDAVKEIKKLDKRKIVSHFNDRICMDSFQLSYAEEQALCSIITKNSKPVSTSVYWY